MKHLKICPIDVGFGGVKFALWSKADDMLCRSFASVAPSSFRASHDTMPIDVVRTEINGMTYETGYEAHLAKNGLGFGRVQRPDYPQSPQYMAMVNAALFYIGQNTIDVLVLGLPVSTFVREKQALIDSMTGMHHFTRLDRNDAEPRVIDCEVKKVLVIRQPMGGLYDAFSNEEIVKDLSDGNTLVLDPGFFTLDWIVAHNKKPIENRCGASNNGGVSAIYKVIASELGRETGETIDIGRIEEAFNKSGEVKTIKVKGETFNLAKYDGLVRGIIQEVLEQMGSQIGTFSDLDNIIVVGGAAELYKRILQPLVPKFNIIVPKDPMFANVRGFQVAGEVWAGNNL